MISKEGAALFKDKPVFIELNGKFYKGVVLDVSDTELILRFNSSKQVYALSEITAIREVTE